MRAKTLCITALLAVSVSALTMTACSTDTTGPAATDAARIALDRKVQELKDRYGWVGQYHTDGLEYVYSELVANRGASASDEFCRIVTKAVKEFHRSARKGEIPFDLIDPGIASGTCAEESGGGDLGRNLIAGDPRVARDEIGSLAASYLDQVGHAIGSATSRDGLLSALLSIQYAAVANLSQEEAGAVVATVSIAISSMDYWEMNLDKWVTIPTLDVPYSKGGASTPIPIAASWSGPRWWSHPFVQGYLKTVGADAMAGARVLYTTWRLGPIGYDAAAAAGLFASAMTAGSLIF